QRAERAGEAHHHQAHRDRRLHWEAQDVVEHRHGEDGASAAQQAERDPDQQREGIPEGDHDAAEAARGGAVRSSRSARVRMSNGFWMMGWRSRVTKVWISAEAVSPEITTS